MMKNCNPFESYRLWCDNVTDRELLDELAGLSAGEIEERFSYDLTFGTGGLRGKMGAGTGRINIYTVAQATQGIANYFGKGKVVIAFDSRLRSKVFATITANVFAASGFETFLFDRLMPTPILSFAVRELSADLGVVITASHNPREYNGYKVYNSDGCQINPEIAQKLENSIQNIALFKDIQWNGGVVNTVPESILKSYYGKFNCSDLSGLKVVYTPLNGAGAEPVCELLRRTGLHLTLVEAQAMPDGNFPTCPLPNPELPEAMSLGLEELALANSDILLATDPDCDRVGVAVLTPSGNRIFTGNELGVLLLNYLCKTKPAPAGSIVVKTFVTTGMAEKIAARHNIACVEVPVGFKFIGEYIGKLENAGQAERYFFGLEESCGYLPVSFVRDKDGVSTSLLVCEMTSWYKSRGLTLDNALEELYNEYGYYYSSLKSYVFDGISGIKIINSTMEDMRNNGIFGWSMEDFMPKSDYSDNMLRFTNQDDSITIRPSGTEPKIKVYFSVCERDAISAKSRLQQLEADIDAIFNN